MDAGGVSVESDVDVRGHDLYGPGPTGPTAPSFVVAHGRGRSCPRVACAGCGALITDVEMAGIVWSPEGWVVVDAPAAFDDAAGAA
jgi:hypothetical protein